MKKIVLLGLASTMLYSLHAEQNIEKDESKEATQVAQEATTTIEAPKEAQKKDSTLKNIVTGAKVSGFGFARFFTINGFDNIGQNGQSQQYRIKLDVTTGKVYGFSATAGIFFSQGSSTPDVGNNTNSAVQGGRGTAFNGNFSDRFNIGQIFASKEFEFGSFSGKLDGGKINITSPLSDNKVDIGTGLVLNAKHKTDIGDFKYHASFYDSWSGDHVGYTIRNMNPHTYNSDSTQNKLENQDAASIGIGNNLFLFGAQGNMLNKALSFDVYVGNMYRLMDFVGYGAVSYNMKLTDSIKLSFLAQTSMAALNNNAQLYLGYKGKSAYSDFGVSGTGFANLASFRGIYNLQAKMSYEKIGVKVGYLGSFGDGYGTLIDYKGGIDTAGKVWNGNITATYEGLGMLGSGSRDNTSINVAYIAAEYGFKIPLKIGLDVAYIFGNTNMPVLNVSPNDASKPWGGGNFIHKAAFIEITPHITYKFFDKLELSLFAATLAGDINFFKTRTELKYTF